MAIPELFENSIALTPDQPLNEALKELPGKPGVCLLAARGDKPIILLHGANMKLLVKRRLSREEGEEKTKKADLRPLVSNIYYKLSYSKFQTQLDYFFLAKSLYPDSWQKLFPRLNSWYIYLDNSGVVPVFKLSNSYSSQSGRFWGPFATKASADRMLESVTIIHNLCRCAKNLANTPNGMPCSYAQMGLCPMVCNGTMAIDQYLKLINSAVDFMDNPINDSIDKLKAEIKTCCEKLEFEQAEKLNRKLNEYKKITGRQYRWVGAMEDFNIACFQPGPTFKLEEDSRKKQTGIIPMTIRPDGLSTREAFPLSESLEQCQQIITSLTENGSTRNAGETLDQYLLDWLCQLLSKSDKGKGLFIRVNAQTTADMLSKEVQAFFAKEQ